jgi:tRNA 2-selenouridine synthase SelU
LQQKSGHFAAVRLTLPGARSRRLLQARVRRPHAVPGAVAEMTPYIVYALHHGLRAGRAKA